jgi:outer membrane protein assembly factor BamE (lipoprotein component of BamABCDE complex)
MKVPAKKSHVVRHNQTSKASILPLLGCAALGGCMTAAEHTQQLGSTEDRQITIGLAQKMVRQGHSQGDVATALGSPNIVTRDASNRETWIYDKIATETSFSQDNGNFASSLSGSGSFPSAGLAGLVGNNGSVNASIGGGYSKSAGAASITQKTLTLVVKFDGNRKVESLDYHSTKF